jgi:LPS-assembly lipoprotein
MHSLGRILLLTSALVLSGCGFSPLYGTGPDGSSVSSQLAGISVDEQNTRLGQLVRNEIVSSVTPAGDTGGRTHRLFLEAIGSEAEAIEAINTESLRQHYTANVSFVLYDNSTGKAVYSGKTFSQVAYDRVDVPAANLQAQVNAQERAAREVGQDIRTRIAAYLATQ